MKLEWAPAWGVASGYSHFRGDWVPSPAVGVEAALEAMGADGPHPPHTSTWVVSRNWGVHVPFEADLRTEDGRVVHVAGHVPREDLPLGYHWLEPTDGADRIRLIVSPGECPRPTRMWGWAVQLYAARSRASWGIGDFADLRRMSSWRRSALGGGMLLVNPLHAVAPTPIQQASPYTPTSRRWRNPIYLRIEEVPGASSSPEGPEGRALNHERLIDRSVIWKLKRAALHEVFAVDAAARAWIDSQGESLRGFATWSALADVHGGDFRGWPSEFRVPGSRSVEAWAAAHDDEITFHAWLQWLIRLQLDTCTEAGSVLVHDLAIGCDPGGADAWLWQDVLASGVTIGAPPDEFNPDGQTWGMPPFDPWRLRAAHYQPFIDVVRAAFRGGGGVRIDHVIGLFRMFWVADGADPRAGVYVRYPWEDLLNILSLEAHRAGAFVIGEDLGTVEPEAREALDQRHVLSYKLLWFEERPPAEWSDLSIAAISTHDLPTLAGVLTGADAEARHHAGLPVDAEGDAGLLAKVGGSGCAQVYRTLSASPAVLATGTLDDALEVCERPNHPGTIDEWPNWSIALPIPLEEIEVDPRVTAVADALASGGRI